MSTKHNKKITTLILAMMVTVVSAAEPEPSAKHTDAGIATAPPDMAVDSPQEAEDDAPASPLGDVYKAPKVDHKASLSGTFPQSEMWQNREGWVELNLMIDKQGKPYEITVIDSSGNAAFEKAAVKNVANLRFEPATLNGISVDAGYAFKYRFASGARGVSPKFAHAFHQLHDSLDRSDKSAAEEALKNLKVTNLYEDAFYNLGRFMYFRHWGSESEQLQALSQAIAYERKSKYLSSKEFHSALAEIFRLQVKLGAYSDALDTFSSFDQNMKDDPTYKKVVSEIMELIASNEALSTRGEISKYNSWNYRLLKRHFSLLVSRGAIAEIKLRCDTNYVLLHYKPDLDYTVPQEYGACHLELLGDNGTQFTLIES